VDDFRDLAKEKGARVQREWFFAGERPVGKTGANIRAEFAVFQLRRD
jgi:hypothetical protein